MFPLTPLGPFEREGEEHAELFAEECVWCRESPPSPKDPRVDSESAFSGAREVNFFSWSLFGRLGNELLLLFPALEDGAYGCESDE